MRFGFDCVFHYVTDMERAIRFYTEVLEMKLVSRDAVARFNVDGVLFELVPNPTKTTVKGSGNARLCLRVEDVRRCIEELRGKGGRTSPVRDVEGGLIASFEDPDGNEIYLWQSGRSAQ